jgi:hypothetical protein
MMRKILNFASFEAKKFRFKVKISKSKRSKKFKAKKCEKREKSEKKLKNVKQSEKSEKIVLNFASLCFA